ncbi:MAG: hypothetical protein KAW51_09915 [Candidatus Lokiarchaeota archaeon]|nr:hypothetical protein [Candidatus Lokiarchaeota archaeon]
MQKFTINAFLDLRLEDGRTNIYVNNKLFMHCKYILLNIPIDKIEDFERIDSIDEIVEIIDGHFKISGENQVKISPKTIFWAHCSNLQVWYENDYNSCLLHRNLAFPLVKALTKAGDKLAASVFKEEVAKRFENSNIKVNQFLLNNRYLDCLNKDELSILLVQTKSNLINSVISQLKKFMKSPLVNYREIKELIDILLFIDLKYDQKYIFCVLNNLNKKFRTHFARFLTLHLNYKEFDNYKIPYGKFITYFEEVLNYLYETYPEINEFLKVIDSGFINSSLSLDEKRSYGYVSYL